jgi:hypothetical protein
MAGIAALVASVALVPGLVHCLGGNAAGDRASGDDGGTGSEACAIDAAEGAVQTFGPGDPRIQYTGRLDLSDPAGPWFAASAVYVTARFRGRSLSAEIQDEPLEPGNSDFFDVVLDGQPPFALALGPGPSWYDLVPVDDAGAPVLLPLREHSVTLVKRTEATIGKTQLRGFRAGELLPPDPSPTPLRRIEIIGDSFACGFGIEATSPTSLQCAENGFGQLGYGQGVEDAYKGYGPLLASLLGAQWHVTCESGVGLVRNGPIADPRPMPEIYPYLYPEETANLTLWPRTQWGAQGNTVLSGTPDLLVIGLGGNDLNLVAADGGALSPIPVGGPEGGPEGGPSLVQGFVQFISQLAADYPGVSILLISNALAVEAAVQIVVSYYAPGGAGADAGAHVYGYQDDLAYPGDGCQQHPDVAQQAAAAAPMAAYIKQVMGW